jgi:hypothetical protein
VGIAAAGGVAPHQSLRCVRRASSTRNLFEGVSARSGTITKQVTTYNASYGVLPCFLTFFTFLFRMHLKPKKRSAGPPKSRENPEIVDDDVSFVGRFLASGSLFCSRSAPFGLPRETTMDDELRDVQPYLVQPDPVKCGRIAVWWPAAPARGRQPILITMMITMMAIRWSRFLEEGSWRRPRVVLSNREGIPGEASGSADSEGRRLSPRPRQPRCYIRFPPFRVGDEG